MSGLSSKYEYYHSTSNLLYKNTQNTVLSVYSVHLLFENSIEEGAYYKQMCTHYVRKLEQKF